MTLRTIFAFMVIVTVSSCSNGIKEQLTHKWKVTKMERKYMVIDIHPKMGFHFLENGTVNHITQRGTKMQGKWFLHDSVISITVKEESKKFRIRELTDSTMVLNSEAFLFYLELLK